MNEPSDPNAGPSPSSTESTEFLVAPSGDEATKTDTAPPPTASDQLKSSVVKVVSQNMLWNRFLRRLARSGRQVTFWVFAVVVIIGASGVGIWLEAYKEWQQPTLVHAGILTAVFTYFPAICAGAVMQIVFGNEPKQVRAIALAVAVATVACVFLHSGGALGHGLFDLAFGLIFCVVSWFCWWYANASDPIFMDDDIRPEDPLGGPPSGDLSGTTEGYNL